MAMKLFKHKTTNIYLIIIFISISFFSSLGFGTLQSIIIDKNESGIYNNKNSIKFNINNIEYLSPSDFIKSFNNIENIAIEKINLTPGYYTGRAIYFNSHYNNSPNIITGRFFTIDDFKNNTPTAIIGKNISSMIYKIFLILCFQIYKSHKNLMVIELLMLLLNYLY